MRLVLFAALLLAAGGLLAQSEVPATVAGKSTLVLKRAPRGEPIQGFSSINLREDGTYWVMADTGHGAGKRRADVKLAFHHLYIDWIHGSAKLLSEEPLQDPHHKLPFPIVNETTRERLLTAADLNVDATQVIGYSIWLADDFGPYLVESSLHGEVHAVYPAPFDARAARRGFGGLAASPDGRLLYAALEGPVWSQENKQWEASPDGREFARILEFDVANRVWTGRVLIYPLQANGHTIADLRLLDPHTALVVERGPQFRRVYKVLFDGGSLDKVAYIDLMQVDMATVEGIEVVDPGYIALSNGDRTGFVLLRPGPALYEP